jgi:YegS/Rv2252/BmrU family lipid kinase
MQITFIVNSQIKKLRKTLKEIGDTFYRVDDVQVTILQTHHAGHSRELAEEITQKGCDYLIAVGGDGTLSEVLNGMMNTNIPTNEYPVLGVLPRGSANDFVKTINISNKVLDLKQAILNKHIQKIDIGKIIIEAKPTEPEYFINIASLGLGPEVVKAMDSSGKMFGSSIAYFSSIIRGFLSYKKRSVLCEADEWQWEGKLLQMAVANGQFFGHGICVAPEASLQDGLFHISLFGELSLFDYLKNLGNLNKGIKINHPAAFYYTAKELKISPVNDQCGIEADGEYLGESPVTATVVPNAIKFLWHV